MKRELKIGTTLINDESDCYVIAEIGHNHQGSLEKAMQLFEAAKDAGVDAVKLQKRDNRSLFVKSLYDAPYLNENSYGNTYGEHREALEFGRAEYVTLQQYARELGITMFATSFDQASADFLAELDMPAFKFASGDLKNTPLLQYVARLGKPMILSTGGGTMDDVVRAVDTIVEWNTQLAVLQCTAAYPAEAEDMHLNVIPTFRRRFPSNVIGLSDHQNGIALAPAAYVLGARIIEKHFTLNRSWKGTDHAFSLEPVGMKKLVRDLRRTRAALGDTEKKVHPMEEKPLFKMGKKLVAARDLPAGHVLTRADIAAKSPNDGLPPYALDSIIGMRTKTALSADEAFAYEKLEASPHVQPQYRAVSAD